MFETLKPSRSVTMGFVRTILTLLATLSVSTLAQQGGFGQKQPLQPIGDVLLLVLDVNKDQKVDRKELQQQLSTLSILFQDDPTGEYAKMFQPIQKAAPHLFELLDANGDQKLTKKELQWVTRFEQSLPAKANKSFRNVVRECFEILDADDNDNLSRQEWNASTQHLSAMAEKLHTLFPIRSSAEQLKTFLEDNVLSSSSNQEVAAAIFEWLDADQDGVVSRQEVGKAYNQAGKKWMETSKQIKEMGPMMAMLGSMGHKDGTRTEF